MRNATKLPHDFMSQEYTAREEGYIFVYLSNEHLTQVDVYFDDVVFTHTPGNLLQYNEYYPFGLQTANSWTRENTTGNQFLGNSGSEFNNVTSTYETFFRGYDPALGRMMQVDPMASKYASLSPYNFSLNDPVYWSDPSGADVTWNDIFDIVFELLNQVPKDPGGGGPNGGAGWSASGGFIGGYGSEVAGMIGYDYNAQFSSWSYTTPGSEQAFVRDYYDKTGITILDPVVVSASFGGLSGEPYSNDQWLNNRLDRAQGILSHSYDFWQTMSNPMVQSIHRGHQAFIDNPWGGGLMAFVTGGPMLGAGGFAGKAALGTRVFGAFSDVGTQVGVRMAFGKSFGESVSSINFTSVV